MKRCVRSTRVSEEDEFIFSRFYELMKDSIDEFQDVESTTTEELLASLMDLIQEYEVSILPYCAKSGLKVSTDCNILEINFSSTSENFLFTLRSCSKYPGGPPCLVL